MEPHTDFSGSLTEMCPETNEKTQTQLVFPTKSKSLKKEMKIRLLFIFVVDTCSVGYTGIYCQKQCPYPGYGDGCQQVCLCSKQRCSVFNGCQSKSKSKFSLR